MKQVSIKQAIIDAADETDSTILRDMPTLVKWAIKADQKIGSYYSYEKKITVVDVVDCKAELPDHCVRVLNIALGDYGCDCDNIFDNGYSGIDAIDTLAGDPIPAVVYYSRDDIFSWKYLDWEIQGNCIVFPMNFDGEKLTIQFLKYVLDREGLPLVNETHLEAISLFIQTKIVNREMWQSLKSSKLFRNTSLQYEGDLKRRYHRAVRNARAEDGKLTPSQERHIRDMVNNAISGGGYCYSENVYY